MRQPVTKAALRMGMAVAGAIAMAGGLGLAGVGEASAASAALKIESGAMWTFQVKNAGCEIDLFQSNDTFTSDFHGDAGTWNGGGATISMTWTAGNDAGQTFAGHFVSTKSPVRYKGEEFDNPGFKAKLVKATTLGC